MELAIRVSGLTKFYGDLLAVDHISFEVEEGEIFGLLGPNGAGKTTTIKMLTTLLRPSEGAAEVYGHDIQREPHEVRRVIGIVFQEPSLDLELTGRENMEFHARLYDVPKGEMENRIEELLQLVELQDWADRLVRTYSGGMRRRLEIARSLLHHPKVLFLDEPTLGLDPQSRRHVWSYISRINEEEGMTIILTTHYMEEADQLCDRVAIIDKGRIVALDTPERLKSIVGGDVLTLEVGSGAKRLVEAIRRRGLARNIQILRGQITLMERDGEALIPVLLRLAEEVGISVNSVSLRKPSLDDVFLYFTGERIRPQGPEPMMMWRIRMMRGRR
ncbi:ATP-binding cassette domain-containing protein [Candidatus Bathyarchaeota archaeon]|nr:ATP-binding cassette domain-containing protein [Candidatus Bathyarchaeota archaeon]